MTTILCFLTIKYQISKTYRVTFVLKKCREADNSRITEVVCLKSPLRHPLKTTFWHNPQSGALTINDRMRPTLRYGCLTALRQKSSSFKKGALKGVLCRRVSY